MKYIIILFISGLLVGCIEPSIIRSQIIRETPPNHQDLLSGSPLERNAARNTALTRANFWALFPLYLVVLGNSLEQGEVVQPIDFSEPPHHSSVMMGTHNVMEMFNSQREIAIEFSHYTEQEQGKRRLAESLFHRDPYIRIISIYTAREQYPELLVESLPKLLVSDTEFVAVEAIRQVAQLKSRETIKPLCDALQNSSSLIRAEAAQALAIMGFSESIEHLWPLLEDNDLYVREKAGKALEDLTGEKFDFPYDGSLQERKVQQVRWKKRWLQKRQYNPPKK